MYALYCIVLAVLGDDPDTIMTFLNHQFANTPFAERFAINHKKLITQNCFVNYKCENVWTG